MLLQLTTLYLLQTEGSRFPSKKFNSLDMASELEKGITASKSFPEKQLDNHARMYTHTYTHTRTHRHSNFIISLGA